MEKNQILHNNRTYTIVDSLMIKNMDFVICMDVRYQHCYFRRRVVNGRDTYVSYEKLIAILPDYQSSTHKNCRNFLDSFINTLRVDRRPQKMLFEKLHELVEEENDNFINDNIPELSMEYFDIKFRGSLSNKTKPTVSQLLEVKADVKKAPIELPSTRFAFGRFVYMMMVVVATLGFLECYTALSNWKQEGQETKDIMAEILAETEITEIDIEELYNVAGDSEVPTVATQNRYGKDYWDFTQVPMMNVDFTNLLRQNSDTVGWLFVNNTNINYPIVQTTNNTFYLEHAFNRTHNLTGWVFGDYRSDFKNFKRNTVIYAHGRADQVMFGSLQNVLSKDWYTNRDNHIIKFSTPDKNTLWQVFSVYTVKAESYYLTHNFENDASYQKFLDTMKSRSIYDFEVDLSTNDKILTLSTCLNSNGDRIVLHARLAKTTDR